MAKQDLLKIKAYITEELENPEAAVDVVAGIIDSYQRLKDFPQMGRKLSSRIEVTTDYRYLISGKYIIFYKMEDIYISIYRILYGKRDYTKLLWEEE